jgi:hypothetical protein
MLWEYKYCVHINTGNGHTEFSTTSFASSSASSLEEEFTSSLRIAALDLKMLGGQINIEVLPQNEWHKER